MEVLVQDVRYGLRTLARKPAFATVAVLTLALGVSAVTVIFSVVDAAVLTPPPFADSERLVLVQGTYDAAGEPQVRAASFLEIEDWRSAARSLDGMAAFGGASLTLTGDGEPERLDGEIVSAGYFSVLEVAPLLGRTFTPDEDRTVDTHPVAVVGHDLWQRRFGGSPDAVGSTVLLNDRSYSVVGVLPPDFGGLSLTAEVWIPTMMVSAVRDASTLDGRGARWLSALARLAPGATAESAQAEMDAIAARLEEAHPEWNTDRGALVAPLPAVYLGSTGQLLTTLLFAVALLLLIACANVANLLLARASARRREIVMRAAVGATGTRLVRQLLTESVVLASLAGGVAFLATLWSVDALVPLIPEGVLPGFVDVRADTTVFGFALLVVLVAGVVSGMAPALWVRGRSPTEALNARGHAGGPAGRRFAGLGLQEAFVVAEVSLALVLLVGAGLMTRSFAHQLAVPLGFDPEGIVSFRVALPQDRYDGPGAARFGAELRDRLLQSAGVRSVALGSDLPLREVASAGTLWTEGLPDDADIRYYRHRIEPGYLGALAIPLVAGRDFQPTDRDGPQVAMVSRAMAERLWPGAAAVGRTLHLDGPESEPVEIVGVTGDVRYRDLTTDLLTSSDPDVFFPFAQRPTRLMEVAVRSDADPATVTASVRQAVAATDPTIPIYELATMESVVRQQTASSRMGSFLLGLFSSIALLLASVGIYGVMAFAVAQRRKELAIRMALGADPGRVRRIVVRQSLVVTGLGLVVGTGAALLATNALASLLFGVGTADPVTFLAVSALMTAMATAAGYLPARRASRLEPLRTLRSE